jgi:hypothetical protein
MPEFADRSQHEDAIAAAILLLLQQQQEWLLHHPDNDPPWDVFEQRTQQVLAPRLASTFVQAGLQLGLAKEQPVSIGDLHRQADAWAQEQASKIAAELTAKTREQVEIAKNRQLDKAALAALLMMLFGSSRAIGVGITETTRAITKGEAAAAVGLGAAGISGGDAVWRTEADGVCAECRHLDGKDRVYWSLFVPDGPPAHPHCRCWLDYA